MPFPHTVAAHEDVPAIAAKYGFSKWEKVWGIDENKSLREAGRTPFALQAGDIVYVPEPSTKPKQYSTENTHDVKVKRMWFDLKVTFVDAFHEPMKNRQYEFERDALPKVTGQTDGDGIATLKVGGHSRRGVVTFKSEDGDVDLRVELDFGHMDPLGSPGATEKMLRNLGFLQDGEDLEDAIEHFQLAIGARPTGVADPQTVTWLDVAHREGLAKAQEKSAKAREDDEDSDDEGDEKKG